ncbi:MAG: recombination protein RecR, partial [Porphyrobacter sp. HL-46]
EGTLAQALRARRPVG